MKTIDSNIDIQALITAEHLRRMAIIYVRQSSREAIGGDDQVNTQLAFARRHGWAEHLIEVISEDIGKSGSSVENRSGWHRLLKQIRGGEVGAVFVSNVSRLTRQVSEYDYFATLALENGVLLHGNNSFINLVRSRN